MGTNRGHAGDDRLHRRRLGEPTEGVQDAGRLELPTLLVARLGQTIGVAEQQLAAQERGRPLLPLPSEEGQQRTRRLQLEVVRPAPGRVQDRRGVPSIGPGQPARSRIEQEIGDYYAACLDEKTINAKGTAPLQDDLRQIAAINNRAGITDVVIHLYRIGATPFLRRIGLQTAASVGAADSGVTTTRKSGCGLRIDRT